MKNVDNLKYFMKKIVFEPFKDAELDLTKYAVAGGAVRDYLCDADIKDIDVFSQDRESEDKLLKFLREKHTLTNENDLLGNFKMNGKWVQVIKGKFFDMQTDQLIKTFDFTICGAMITGDERTYFLDTFFQDCLAKHLRVNVLPFPLSSLERMQKYIKKGYTACNGTLLALTKSLQAVDLNNPNQDSLSFYPDGTPRFVGVD